MTSPFIYAEDLLENSHGSLEALDHFTTFLYVLVCFYSNTPLRRVLDSSKEKDVLTLFAVMNVQIKDSAKFKIV